MKLRKLNMWKCLTCQTIMPSLAINNCTVCHTDKIHGESLIMWAKDWPCLNCGKNNFRQNIKCFYCSAFVNKKRAPQHNQISGKKQKLNDSESDDDVMIIQIYNAFLNLPQYHHSMSLFRLYFIVFYFCFP